MAVAVIAGLGFLLFGLGGSQLNSPIAQAATVSSNTPGFRMRLTMDMTAPGLSGPLTATGGGIVDLRDHAMSMSLAMNLGADAQAVQQAGGSTMRMQVVMRGDVIYAKLPAAVVAQLPMSGRNWVEADLGKMASLPGLSTFGSDPASTDPSQMLRSLESVSDSVVNMGSEHVDGVETTHYRAEVDVSHLFDGLPSSVAAEIKPALSLMEKSIPGGAIPMDVWIDGDHLVRRVQTNLEMDLPNGSSMQETMTLDVSSYGPQPEPQAPPANQVVDLNSLIAAAAG